MYINDHFYKAFSAVLTCVGTGSTDGSIFKGRRKNIDLRFSPQKIPVELGPYDESLIGAEQMASSPGNTFVHSYLQVSFDGHME